MIIVSTFNLHYDIHKYLNELSWLYEIAREFYYRKELWRHDELSTKTERMMLNNIFKMHFSSVSLIVEGF